MLKGKTSTKTTIIDNKINIQEDLKAGKNSNMSKENKEKNSKKAGKLAPF